MTALSILLFGVFLLLGLVHFNWALGGSWGFDAALPTTESGQRVLNPKKADSAIVGLGLTTFGIFYLIFSGLFLNMYLPEWIFSYGRWVIPIIFILRAIGDFKYIGFFKKVRSTTFGKMDTKLHSPLCLGIGISGLIIAIFY